MDLTNFTKQQLLEELARREREVRDTHVRAVSMHLTKAIVDCFCPDHCRTSCSDKCRNNGFGSADGTLPRCTRCALLDLVEDGVASFLPEGVWVRLELTEE